MNEKITKTPTSYRGAFIDARDEIRLHLIQAHLSAFVPLKIIELRKQGGPTELQLGRAHGFHGSLGEKSDRANCEGSDPSSSSSEQIEAYYAPFRGNNPLAVGGDAFLFGGKAGEAGSYMGSLTETLAVLSFQPGGVTAFGLHFEAAEPEWRLPYER